MLVPAQEGYLPARSYLGLIARRFFARVGQAEASTGQLIRQLGWSPSQPIDKREFLLAERLLAHKAKATAIRRALKRARDAALPLVTGSNDSRRVVLARCAEERPFFLVPSVGNAHVHRTSHRGIATSQRRAAGLATQSQGADLHGR